MISYQGMCILYEVNLARSKFQVSHSRRKKRSAGSLLQRILEEIADIHTAKIINHDPSPMEELVSLTEKDSNDGTNYDLKDVNNLLLKHAGLPKDRRSGPQTYVFGHHTDYRHPGPRDRRKRYRGGQLPSFGSHIDDYEDIDSQSSLTGIYDTHNNDLLYDTSMEIAEVMIFITMALLYLCIVCIGLHIFKRIIKGLFMNKEKVDRKYGRVSNRSDRDFDNVNSNV